MKKKLETDVNDLETGINRVVSILQKNVFFYINISIKFRERVRGEGNKL